MDKCPKMDVLLYFISDCADCAFKVEILYSLKEQSNSMKDIKDPGVSTTCEDTRSEKLLKYN